MSLGFYWDDGKENGNCHSILGSYWGNLGITENQMEKLTAPKAARDARAFVKYPEMTPYDLHASRGKKEVSTL